MVNSDFGGEQPANYEQKCLCVLVVDVSGSMQGDPMQQLNTGLQSFHQAIISSKDPVTPNRLEVALVTFDNEIKVVQQPSLVFDFSMPVLQCGGTTKLVDGVREGMRLIDERKAWYKSTHQDYYRPYLILITDGEPDSDQDVVGLGGQLRAAVDGKQFVFWAFGTDAANMATLSKLAHPSTPPLKFSSADFSEFFKWLSKSFSQITASKEGATLDLSPDSPSLFQHTI